MGRPTLRLALAALVGAVVLFGGGQASASEPMPRDCGATAGWQYKISDNIPNRHWLVQRLYHKNGTDEPRTASFTATKSDTFEWNTEVSVSASAGVAIFAEVKAEVRAGIKKSYTAELGVSDSGTVAAHSILIGDYGVAKERVDGVSFYRWSNCNTGHHVQTKMGAGFMAGWEIYYDCKNCFYK